jgi:hypothetical protein
MTPMVTTTTTAPDRTFASDTALGALGTPGPLLAWLQAAAQAEISFRARSSTDCPLATFAREALGLPHPQVSFTLSRRHAPQLVHSAPDGLRFVVLPRWCRLFVNLIDARDVHERVSRETALNLLRYVMRLLEAEGAGREKLPGALGGRKPSQARE